MVIEEILNKNTPNKTDLIQLLQTEDLDMQHLFRKSKEVKEQTVQNKVYFRGLIEFSNICRKDCLYCGIRKSNNKVHRYNIEDEEILKAARFAYENHFGSLVLQSGEQKSPAFTKRITNLLDGIQTLSKGSLRVTLSCGEQERETYKQWYEHGAARYLLRIETSDRNLYAKLHPNDALHDFDQRLQCLYNLKDLGYQTGSGVMIGLPFQTIESLADDLLWMQTMDLDMVGMGPYLEHEETPLYAFRYLLMSQQKRFELSLKMIACLRILMKDINIAATTALQAIDKGGREKALKIGANVIMPNITPGKFRNDYHLYSNKPSTDENLEDCKRCLEIRIYLQDNKIAYDEWGDSKHYHNRMTKTKTIKRVPDREIC
ncbi:MAG: [FeFe] hydrogenase H-cluster radical SAM maturase HydE [Candidatus Marinimicrobia bacterium]|nr:[FeFe] hydrogenase H-cluster radical SAM maturase HydE [Candidatus Neomarinimicrobiota bacterium]MDD5581810.1 [FeFe] hydrogenase H-cluster radical SAM maturase HydE [Candidatus Neomarinimicrobiota bacterium]